MLVTLGGGVGASRFLQGLVRVVPPEELDVIVNTGDDVELHGLHISPDVDTVMYTLAGLVDEERGWGIRGDTFRCLEMLGRYGCETWFRLGDMDLATHIYRTHLLRRGMKLSEVTDLLRRLLGVKARIIPMTDDRVETWIRTPTGEMHFQEYYVKRGAVDPVLGVVYRGIKDASPAPGVLDAIRDADGVIICPSNPVVSVMPILSIRGVRGALKRTGARVLAISPIVGGAPVRGPADKLMRGLGAEVSAYGVSKLYSDVLDHFIMDRRDEEQKTRIEELGIDVTVADTIMRSLEDKVRLARVAVEALGV